jgi:hypothetical protein
MKTSELTGAALDWAVARLESEASPTGMDSADILLYRSTATNAWMYKRWAIHYSTDWAQGGPIIEREIDSLLRYRVNLRAVEWEATAQGNDQCTATGPTPLIAAMRCYVASKLGDEVDVPEELCQPSA